MTKLFISFLLLTGFQNYAASHASEAQNTGDTSDDECVIVPHSGAQTLRASCDVSVAHDTAIFGRILDEKELKINEKPFYPLCSPGYEWLIIFCKHKAEHTVEFYKNRIENNRFVVKNPLLNELQIKEAALLSITEEQEQTTARFSVVCADRSVQYLEICFTTASDTMISGMPWEVKQIKRFDLSDDETAIAVNYLAKRIKALDERYAIVDAACKEQSGRTEQALERVREIVSKLCKFDAKTVS